MYVTWQTILLGFLALCGGFTSVCVAFGWLAKIIKSVRKPGNDINEKLDRDNKRIIKLEEAMEYQKNSSNLIMRTLFVILGELAVNNDKDGKIAEAQGSINEFFLKQS